MSCWVLVSNVEFLSHHSCALHIIAALYGGTDIHEISPATWPLIQEPLRMTKYLPKMAAANRSQIDYQMTAAKYHFTYHDWLGFAFKSDAVNTFSPEDINCQHSVKPDRLYIKINSYCLASAVIMPYSRLGLYAAILYCLLHL